MMKKVLIMLILLLTGCGTESYTSDIKQVMAANEYVIVDVRESWEYSKGHVVDAINIPHYELEQTTTLDKDKVIFVYCQSGSRSAIAYETLSSLGYKVYDLGGYASVDLPKE